MPLKSLIVIALRLYAVYWLIQSLSQFLAIIPIMWIFFAKMHEGDSQTSDMSSFYGYALLPIVFLFLATGIWWLASKISSLVTKGHDTQLDFSILKKEDVYNFGFVFLGIYFFLSTIQGVFLSDVKFIAFDYPLEESNPQKGHFLWLFISQLLVLGAGLASVLGAQKWTRKLLLHEKRTEQVEETYPSSESAEK